MAKTKQEKLELAQELTQKFEQSKASIVAEYSGITAGQLASLRRELRQINGEFRVVKNRVAKKSLSDKPELELLDPRLTGPVGIVYLKDDIGGGAKAVFEFAKQNKQFKVSGGVFEGKNLTAQEFKSIADLPSKEVLLGMIVGSLVAPHRGLLQILNGVSSKLVRTIDAIKDQKTS